MAIDTTVHITKTTHKRLIAKAKKLKISIKDLANKLIKEGL